MPLYDTRSVFLVLYADEASFGVMIVRKETRNNEILPVFISTFHNSCPSRVLTPYSRFINLIVSSFLKLSLTLHICIISVQWFM